MYLSCTASDDEKVYGKESGDGGGSSSLYYKTRSRCEAQVASNIHDGALDKGHGPGSLATSKRKRLESTHLAVSHVLDAAISKIQASVLFIGTDRSLLTKAIT